jgi:hypothetical protein
VLLLEIKLKKMTELETINKRLKNIETTQTIHLIVFVLGVLGIASIIGDKVKSAIK